MYTNHQIRNFRHFLFKKENTRPFIRLVKDNKKELFYSLYDCAKFLGCDPRVLWDAFINQQPFQGYTLCYIKGTDPEAIHEKLYRHHQLAARKPGLCRPVKVVDLFTGKVNSYPSIKAAATAIGIPEGNVRASISTPEKQRLLYEQYVVADEQCSLNFLTDAVRARLISSIRVPIVVFDKAQDTLSTFSSLAAYLRITRFQDKLYNSQRRLRLKGVIGFDNRYYVIRQTPLIKPLNDDELRRHFLYIIKEVIDE